MKKALVIVVCAAVCACAPLCAAQTSPPAAQAVASAPAASPTMELYRQLRTAGLDATQTYRIRDVSIDRNALHVTFNDGTISFMHAVDGHVTGGFFEGEGEVLVSPSSLAERTSLNLFTGAPILDEHFANAFIRFNDDTYNELKPQLRPADNGQEFTDRWDAVCRTLADVDALRLLASFLDQGQSDDRELHLRVGGGRLGTFDVMYASRAPEQVWIGQFTRTEDGDFYDVWTAFSRGGMGAGPEVTGETGGEWLHPTDFKIRATLQPPHDLQAETEVTIEPRQSGRRLAVFELSHNLKISSLTMHTAAGDAPLEYIQNEPIQGSQLARRGNDLVAVVFPAPLVSGQQVQLKFVYAGPVMAEAGGGLMYVGARGMWYPNRGLDMATFDMEFHYPQPWVLVASGKRVSEKTQGADQVSHWMSEQPIPLAGFNLGQYDHATAKAGDVSVAAYAGHGMENAFVPSTTPPVAAVQQSPTATGPPFWRPGAPNPNMNVPVPALAPTPAAHMQSVADNTAHTIEWFSHRLGAFPYSSLALSQMPGKLSQGWPGIVFLSSYVFVSPELHNNDSGSMTSLMIGKLVPAHETAHQWFGDAMVWQSYHDQWIMEALANYCALLYVQQQDPNAIKTVLDHYRSELLQKTHGSELTQAGAVTLGQRLESSKFPTAYERIVYGRGTWLIHMLHELMRDEAPRRPTRTKASAESEDPFFRVLHDLVERYRGKKLSTADLQKAFEAALPPSAEYEGHKSLDWFFQSWVDGSSIPRFDLQDVKFVHHGTRLVATGKIAMHDAPEQTVTSLPIYAQGETSKSAFVARVFADGSESTFSITVPPGTKKLQLDPMETVLRRE